MRVIFFHHAGGDQYFFLPFRPLLDKLNWEAVYYDLPGHGDRFSEPLLSDAHQVADDAFECLASYFTGDYLFFGNSMGALIGYLVMHKILAKGLPPPRHFFAAARKCPESYETLDIKQPVPDAELWDMVRDFEGPQAFLENEELKALYAPILRADYYLLRTYKHNPKPVLNVPATALYGTKDQYSREEMQAWRKHFDGEVEVFAFDGGHFFVKDQPEPILDLIKSRIV